MIPVIAIVGRPNVGKSTLFNCLTKTRDAIVADMPGVTRDRQYGHGRRGEQSYIVIDTGGIGESEEAIDKHTTEQARLAIAEADIVLFLVDARAGLTAADQLIADELRRVAKHVVLVVNKIDGLNEDVVSLEFFQLGFTELRMIAAAHGQGVTRLINTILPAATEQQLESADTQDDSIHIAVIGRPNVGKSTLVNRILGENRVLVYDAPGTTRDSIYIPFERAEQTYTLIDTAGVRRRARVSDAVEKFSIIKTLRAIDEAHVVILVIDARTGIVDQDLRLLGYIIESGRALVIAINKWDGLSTDDREQVKRELKRRLSFIDYAQQHMISALHGTGVGNLFTSIQQAYASATKTLSSSHLTSLLTRAVEDFQPPLVKGRRVKLLFAHPGGTNPPQVIIHGRQTDALSASYQRYLNNYFHKALKLKGTPLQLQFKSSSNPYAGRKNKLTPNQLRKRKRLLKFVKKNK